MLGARPGSLAALDWQPLVLGKLRHHHECPNLDGIIGAFLGSFFPAFVVWILALVGADYSELRSWLLR